VFSFHRPETLREWLAQGNTVRARLRYLPPLIPSGLRDCQVEAITNLERSFAEARPRALIQMATGSGKTYTAVSFAYRLVKFANILFFDRKPASETPWTQQLWIYDLRTNKHFTLKTNPLQYDDLGDFITCYHPENRFDRHETERFRAFSCADLVARDKASLDLFWLKDKSLEDSENLPDPDLLAREIVENLEGALEQFNSIIERLDQE
jgi:Type III restriction enzyme, res subunit